MGDDHPFKIRPWTEYNSFHYSTIRGPSMQEKFHHPGGRVLTKKETTVTIKSDRAPLCVVGREICRYELGGGPYAADRLAGAEL